MTQSTTEETVERATGKLAVLLPGMGSVATTFVAGVEAIRKGITDPVGSVSQRGVIDVGEQTIPIGELLELASLQELEFGGWDIYDGTAFDAALEARVLSGHHLDAVEEALAAIKPMAAVFDERFVRNLSGPNTKAIDGKRDQAEALREDIRRFIDERDCDRAVAIWCGSTEAFVEPSSVHIDLEALEEGLDNDDPDISPSMIYAYACIKEGVPYANGAPNLTTDCGAIVELARRRGVAVAGKDFKTGQTLLKTIVAPGLASRHLGVSGWYSTNILGNRDGEVLDEPENFKTKEESKLSVLESIFDCEVHPELYDDLTHKVRIDYYPPRGDNKEGWDNIDIFGWMGYPMQIKINFLCRDSILAAPLVLDLALFLDAAQRGGASGVQDWLSFFFKSPQCVAGQVPAHDLFEQRRELRRGLLELASCDRTRSSSRSSQAR